MFLRMVFDEKLAQAAYLIGCQRMGEAIVIDPERDVDRYEELAASNGLRIVAVAETHIHADFVSGARELAEKGAKVYVSDEGDADWKYQWLDKKVGGGSYSYRLLKNGDRFSVGGIELKAVHSPGHTPEHLSFEVTDRGGGADKPIGVATGDFVFVGDLGRPDLLESAVGHSGKAEESANQLFRSTRAFMEWPDYLQIWPAHGAGSACGKALGAVPQSTVGYEKMFNASIRASASEGQFVEHILSGQPEPPLYFARMKQVNREGPVVLGGVPRPREVDIADLRAIDGRHDAIIDTRPWSEFMKGHVPGALSQPMGMSFSTDAGSMISEKDTMYLIVERERVDEAVRALIRVGLDKFGGWFDAGRMDEYARGGGELSPSREVDVTAARAMMDKARPFVLDVRRNAEFMEGHIPGAVNISHTRLLSRMAEVPQGSEVLVNCRSGSRSSRASALLERQGYHVTNLAGGMMAWERSGAPVSR